MTKDNYNGINPETLALIKKELEEKRSQLLRDLADIEGNVGEKGQAKFPQYGSKPDENAQEIGEYTTNVAQDKVLNDALRDVENALKRIEEGTYGICKYCKKPIAEKRLMARPVASACVECKTKLQNAA